MDTIVLVHISSLAGTDITPIVPALEKIWRDSKGQSLADFNFRTVTSKFNELVYQYPIRCASCAGCAATLQCVATRSMSSCFHPDLPACSCHTALMLSLCCCVYPCSIPERYSLVIRSLLTQEGICMTLKPQFHFLEVAYPYVARFVEESARVCVCWWRWRGEGG